MKCDSLVINSMRVTSKGKTLHHRSVMIRQIKGGRPSTDMELVERFQKIEGPKWQITSVFTCGGDIEAQVSCDVECNDCSPTLEIQYSCVRCKTDYWHPLLPSEYDIEEWLNRTINELPQERTAKGRDSARSAAADNQGAVQAS